jgi:hypothetical protein
VSWDNWLEFPQQEVMQLSVKALYGSLAASNCKKGKLVGERLDLGLTPPTAVVMPKTDA